MGKTISAQEVIEEINRAVKPHYISGVFAWVEKMDPGMVSRCLDNADAGFASGDPEKIRLTGIQLRNEMLDFIDRYKRAVHSTSARAFLRTIPNRR